jgi:hypothetical protein
VNYVYYCLNDGFTYLVIPFFHIFLIVSLLLLILFFSQNAILALDGTVLDIDQVENLIKFCPTKEEVEMLKVNTIFRIV